MKRQRVQIRIIRCPMCGDGHLLDASEKADLRTLRLFPPNRCEDAEWFVKCPLCRRQIGVAVVK